MVPPVAPPPLPLSVSVPPPDLVMPKPEPLIAPWAVKLLPEFTAQIWLAPRVMEFEIDRLTVDDDMSMPPAPSVSVPSPVMAMSVKAPATLMPRHELGLPKVRPAPRELLFQAARLQASGTVPPVQLAPAVRSVPVPALLVSPAIVTAPGVELAHAHTLVTTAR